jgi:tRNA pseudouridine38-40 synthase
MPRYRLTIEYQGTNYRGWQEQKNARSVQGTILEAIRHLHPGKADLQGAGRTDAGVHAIAQVAHLEIDQRFRDRDLVYGLNDLLPADINVLEARAVPDRFHARHAAVSRSYLYQISRRRTAFAKKLVWWVKEPLDAGAMEQAARCLVGMHDFASFADARMERDKSTLVLMEEVAVAEADDLILLRFRASHFLWKMVRRLVGSLAQVGRGRLDPPEFEALLAPPAGSVAELTAPPSGLFLEEVIYPGEVYTRPLRPVLAVSSSGR